MRCPMTRARMSAAPPGLNGTTTRIGRDGYAASAAPAFPLTVKRTTAAIACMRADMAVPRVKTNRQQHTPGCGAPEHGKLAFWGGTIDEHRPARRALPAERRLFLRWRSQRRADRRRAHRRDRCARNAA